MFFIFVCFLLSSTSALKFGGPDFTAPFVQDVGSGRTIAEGSDLTVTVTRTNDVFETTANSYYNTVPIIVTEFRKSTVTLPTREVLRTPVDDLVRIQTQLVTHVPTTETVTDVFSQHSLQTEVSTDSFTVTHLYQDILQTTVTSVIVKTFTFRPTIVRTVLSTELERITETEFYTSTIFHNRPIQRGFY